MAKKIISKQIVCDSNVFINLLRNDTKTIKVVEEIGEEKTGIKFNCKRFT